VREALSIGFPGGTYAHLFDVADVEATGVAMNGEVHTTFDETDFLARRREPTSTRTRSVRRVRNQTSRDVFARR